MGRAVDGLVAQGLVAKRANPADSRSWLVSLTPAGNRRQKALNDQLVDHAKRVMGRLSSNERAAVNRSLGLLLRALRDDAGKAAAKRPFGGFGDPAFAPASQHNMTKEVRAAVLAELEFVRAERGVDAGQ